MNVCFASAVVLNNKEFQKMLNSFIEADIVIKVSASDENFLANAVIVNHKNLLPISRTNGYYVINEYIFKNKIDLEKIVPFKVKKFKTISDFQFDNYLRLKNKVDSLLEAFKSPNNLNKNQESKKKRRADINQELPNYKRRKLK